MKKKSRITIEEIAKMLNVSKATVSNSLTGNRYVSRKTSNRVKEICRKYGYSTNLTARSLRTQKTNVIGVTVPDITEPFYSLLVRCVEEELKIKGYQILLGSYNFDFKEEEKLIHTFQRFPVDGMIIIAGLNETDADYGVLSESIPVVYLDRHPKNWDIPTVVADHKKIGIDAVDYLAARGHKEIAHLTIPYCDFKTAELRVDGFTEGMKKNKLVFRKSSLLIYDNIRLNEIPTSLNIAKTISSTGITALFAVSDYVAIGLLKGLSMLGVRVPEDISILSVTNVPYSLVTTPSLSSIDLSPRYSAKKAVQLLLDLVKGDVEKSTWVKVPHCIVERESVKFVVSGNGRS